MADTPKFLADRLLQEGDRVVNFINGLKPEQWIIILYPDQGTWTMQELLAHFVSAEIGRRLLIAEVSTGGEGAPADFDIDQFNQREVEKLTEVSRTDLLNKFNQERLALATLVSELSPHDLDRIGNDPFLGMVPVSDMIKLTYRHNQIHLREVRRYIE